MQSQIMRCLGIDYGEKRVGLSYGDELGVAVPLPAAVFPNSVDRFNAIETLIGERRITHLIIGYPYNMDDSIGFKAKEVDAFISELEARFQLPVHRVDERLTTYQAVDSLKKSGKKMLRESRGSGEVDSHAAMIILQDFLDQHTPFEEGN